MSIVWIVNPQELPPLNINAMAPVTKQYILKTIPWIIKWFKNIRNFWLIIIIIHQELHQALVCLMLHREHLEQIKKSCWCIMIVLSSFNLSLYMLLNIGLDIPKHGKPGLPRQHVGRLIFQRRLFLSLPPFHHFNPPTPLPTQPFLLSPNNVLYLWL